MKPLFSYYGAKWKLAGVYGPPQRDHVIEPFAGAAGYSCFWEPKKVTLIEQNPQIYDLWKYLQRVSPAELMRLPTNVSHVDELPSRVCPEARCLIGFWFDHGLARPAKHRSNWAQMPSRAPFFWGETIKLRIACQVRRIKHWKIIQGSYEEAPDTDAHWHIDPPYNNAAGQGYPFRDIDYAALARWCKDRPGFVQVCENDGAAWLPFKPFSIVSTCRPRGYSVEVVYEREDRTLEHQAGSIKLTDRRRIERVRAPASRPSELRKRKAA
jgi:hypothetical protein